MKKESKNTKSSIIPLGDKVLLTEIITATKTQTGILLPDSVDTGKGLKEGKVIAVGKGKYIDGKLIEVDVKKGDTVLFSWGDQITIDGVEYYLVRETEISAKLE